MKLYSIWFVLILLIVSCENTKQNQFVALVGDTLIKEQDIEYTIKIEKIYGSGDVSREEALIVLIDDALDIEVGKLLGVSVEQKDIEDLTIKLDKGKTEDSRFEQVKKIFSGNSYDYSRIYLQPMALNKKLRLFYANNQNINSSSVQLIRESKELIDRGKSFEQTGSLKEIEYRKYNIGGKESDNNKDMPKELETYIKK